MLKKRRYSVTGDHDYGEYPNRYGDQSQKDKQPHEAKPNSSNFAADSRQNVSHK